MVRSIPTWGLSGLPLGAARSEPMRLRQLTTLLLVRYRFDVTIRRQRRQ